MPTVPEEFAPLGRWTASVEWTRRTSTPVKPQTRQDISSIGWMPDCRREAAAAGFASERDPPLVPAASLLADPRSFVRPTRTPRGNNGVTRDCLASDVSRVAGGGIVCDDDVVFDDVSCTSSNPDQLPTSDPRSNTCSLTWYPPRKGTNANSHSHCVPQATRRSKTWEDIEARTIDT